MAMTNSTVSGNTAWAGGGLGIGKGVNLYSTLTLIEQHRVREFGALRRGRWDLEHWNDGD